ncbi:hypothetical protein ACHAWU_007567 [Discostella pseudostelligera]|uniref:Anaphase-promoting complex subunit CDC26 n=1 Tax=Discostella pseudostelligera TaxID=259834 RepID=A0ABD3M7W7_9STRA
MALRRPPTRIELKADDVDEYDKIMKERRLIAEQQAMREKSQQQKPGSDFGATPSSQLSSQKKISAAERIGYRKSAR